MQSIEDLQDRPAQRFPNIDHVVIEAAVQVEHARLGAFRDYVPVLVEHAVRDMSAQLAHRDSDEISLIPRCLSQRVVTPVPPPIVKVPTLLTPSLL